MTIEWGRIAEATAALTLDLEEGTAEHMGDGVYVVDQNADGVGQRVTLTTDDLRRMLAMA